MYNTFISFRLPVEDKGYQLSKLLPRDPSLVVRSYSLSLRRCQSPVELQKILPSFGIINYIFNIF